MPPGKVLQPVLKMKVDELFLCWLSESSTQAMLQDCLQRIKMPGGPVGVGGDAGQPGPPFAAPALACRPRGLDSPGAPSLSPASTALPLGAASSARSGPPVRGPRRSAGTRVVQTRKEQPLPPAASLSIPTFYFPRGRPQDAVNVDAIIAKIERTFAQFPHERATMGDMGRVAKACGCPLYWKGPLFCGAGGERTGSVSVHKFVAMWRKMLQSCHDDAAKFVHLLVSPGGSSLAQEDFIPFLQDVVNTHPGLAFLKEASEFHSRYITTVIQRIFYTVNRSWSGRITCAELRRSTFLQPEVPGSGFLGVSWQNVALLEDEVDINQLTEFFSYEHFYVIYCKFWELDTDHDLLIDAQDLARHNDHAISTKMIERIFSGAVTRGKKVQKEGKISYADFVWFLISEEDKKTPTSIEYWFRCMDLDGDGVLSMFELEYFYEEQCRRLDSMAIEALPFEDCLCQMLDLVKPQSEGRITLHDLKRCKLASVFFDTFFNIEKYLDHEQREQISLFRESESEGPELSDWERYAAEEYDILVAEEAMGEPWEDGYEAELSPVDQKLSALRSPLAQRPFFEVPTGLGAVELYEYEHGGDDLPPS
ncbi:serine/threonine-protein phosphatase 2A regulatory subunit B'' subunit beta isoform X1 [Sagmatias obliquidens]|uniref:Serine/threonine-protein phosphatase 2A regulatory subunit B'' subunit beta isoform X1 n=2 Tax=Delphinidae TaxID=9726 RepID=A0A6J3QUB7_TURTR|nr:serine/threonine-protein phosphatase 2A regulatory subunit B'' subunit beta isoform X1 [Lagenorhynchus obliquidens]XP_033706095.1 serine/threonine-protein phosphatase 2A regulatory subunit B'' subunit beta isoform X1 [Tursiops truncatus]